VIKLNDAIALSTDWLTSQVNIANWFMR